MADESKLAYHERERRSRLGFARAHPELSQTFKSLDERTGEHVPSIRQLRKIAKDRDWVYVAPANVLQRPDETKAEFYARKLKHRNRQRDRRYRKYLAEGLDRPERAEADSYAVIY